MKLFGELKFDKISRAINWIVIKKSEYFFVKKLIY